MRDAPGNVVTCERYQDPDDPPAQQGALLLLLVLAPEEAPQDVRLPPGVNTGGCYRARGVGVRSRNAPGPRAHQGRYGEDDRHGARDVQGLAGEGSSDVVREARQRRPQALALSGDGHRGPHYLRRAPRAAGRTRRDMRGCPRGAGRAGGSYGACRATGAGSRSFAGADGGRPAGGPGRPGRPHRGSAQRNHRMLRLEITPAGGNYAMRGVFRTPGLLSGP